MVYTPEEFNYNSPMSLCTHFTVKKTNTRKSINQSTKVLDVKNKTAVHRLGAAKLKHKYIRAGIMLWYSIPKRLRHIKINDQVKSSLKLVFTT